MFNIVKNLMSNKQKRNRFHCTWYITHSALLLYNSPLNSLNRRPTHNRLKAILPGCVRADSVSLATKDEVAKSMMNRQRNTFALRSHLKHSVQKLLFGICTD